MTTQPTSTNSRGLAQLLIVLGGLFLVSQIFGFGLGNAWWTLFVILPGIPFLYVGLTSDNAGLSVLVFPGAFATGTGLMLLYTASTGHWESWAYIWVLYGVIVGWAMTVIGGKMGNRPVQQSGQSVMRFAFALFLIFAVFFEFFIYNGVGTWLWPLLLVGVGVWMLRGDRNLDGMFDDLRGAFQRDGTIEKAKRDQPNGVSAEINPELKRKIEQALAEDDGPRIV